MGSVYIVSRKYLMMKMAGRKHGMSLWFKYDLVRIRPTTHPKFDLSGVRTNY